MDGGRGAASTAGDGCRIMDSELVVVDDGRRATLSVGVGIGRVWVLMRRPWVCLCTLTDKHRCPVCGFCYELSDPSGNGPSNSSMGSRSWGLVVSAMGKRDARNVCMRSSMWCVCVWVQAGAAVGRDVGVHIGKSVGKGWLGNDWVPELGAPGVHVQGFATFGARFCAAAPRQPCELAGGLALVLQVPGLVLWRTVINCLMSSTF